MPGAALHRRSAWVRVVESVILLALVAMLIRVGAAALRAGTGDAPETLYGGWALAPALVAIGLAVVTRQVLPSLAAGILVAAYMVVPCLPSDETYGAPGTVLAGLRIAVETYVVGAMADPDHIKVMVFTLTIGAMVGIIGSNGGTAALVRLVSRRASRKGTGQVVAWAAGLVVFFDDYANSMIVGPTMRPIFDRLGISRAKLAYIVDSTAAPVASLALIGTWIGAEIGFIQAGFDKLSGPDVPQCLTGVTAYDSFVYSIPYRFYPILALLLVAVIAVSGRDFGPMRRAERSAPAPPASTAEAASGRGRWWLGGVPILVLIVCTIGIILATGLHALPKGEPASVQAVLSRSDPYASILYAAIASAAVAVLLGVTTRASSLAQAMDAGLEGMARMFPAIVVLVLAWALSSGTQALHLGHVTTTLLRESRLPAEWLPVLVFLAAAGVSLATGTSWGTMGILCPVVVEVAARLVADAPPDAGRTLFFLSVGSVLAGAIFGDHCSPISDTTVLSAAASECSLEEHVWTQAPYALLAAVLAVLAIVCCSVLGLSAPVGLGVCAGLLIVFVLNVGKRSDPPAT